MSDSSLTLPPHDDDSGPNRLPLKGVSASNGQWSTPVGGIDGGYLVIQSAGRWSDVFRLSAPGQVILGRSSNNDIAIRSEKASRQHARVWSTAAGWMIEDLGSRNGTFLAGRRIQAPTALSDGDKIEIAGFSLQFVHQIQSAEGPVASPRPAGATEDHLTLAMEAASITDRRAKSEYLHSDPLVIRSPAQPGALVQNEVVQTEKARATLLQLAFELAGAETAAQAIDLVLDRLAASIRFRSAGAFVVDSKSRRQASNQPPQNQPAGNRQANPHSGPDPSMLTLVATRHSNDAAPGSSSYRRPADTAIASVIGPDGQAILARNVSGDRTLATENSQGEIDAVSMILAPVKDREENLLGMLHLLTTDKETVLSARDLEFVLAVAEILAESLRNLRVRGKLDRSLRRSQRQIRTLQKQIGGKVQIVGQSDAVRDIIEKISMVAPTHATVLVRGESGVGKELVASAIHHASGRASAPLVCMNCAALSPSLLESELFGHEKGAFTGATDRKQGKFEAADGGTLMLDEIGEMDAEIQAKFLRVLEGHPFERVGGQSPIKVDVRVVAATNRDLQAMVAEGKFRQDLFYRLHVVEMVVPPLRKRGSDILLLAEHFLAQFNEQMGRRITTITDAAKRMLLDYRWPGNIRELRNVIERAVVLNTGSTIDAEHLLLTPAMSAGTGDAESIVASSPVEISLAELERSHIERVLRHTDGNKSRAAAILGIERSTLDRKLKKFDRES
ncbi:sigma 54-interacting transcriptional regulator [Stieleria sp. ICT_E10.1]|uniref:sigma 54-interacting transcriptional regulator n=1 Tax=Stieleria sedimenti TaxID=2976331 RepID=UPI0021801133|nr:sigma 54-interacting transcriptional regulator [Stieleria sedimenti]MCS7468171.1 sigma 54-interacting transcriptional regulator [Stieleria sedimenti]